MPNQSKEAAARKSLAAGVNVASLLATMADEHYAHDEARYAQRKAIDDRENVIKGLVQGLQRLQGYVILHDVEGGVVGKPIEAAKGEGAWFAREDVEELLVAITQQWMTAKGLGPKEDIRHGLIDWEGGGWIVRVPAGKVYRLGKFPFASKAKHIGNKICFALREEQAIFLKFANQ
jgi:hypothetical protein